MRLQGVLLDGFPRTVPQAKELDAMLERTGREIGVVLFFDVPESELRKRIAHRAEIDHRADDSPEAYIERMREYEEKTAPVIGYYEDRGTRIEYVNGNAPIEAVTELHPHHLRRPAPRRRGGLRWPPGWRPSASSAPRRSTRCASRGRSSASASPTWPSQVRAGITTLDLDREADTFIRDHGCIPGFLGYQDYPNSLCVSVNDEVVHGIPGPRVIEDGDLVSLDCGLILDGWWADSGLSVACGEPSPEVARLIDVTREALDRGIAMARPGNTIGDIGHAIQTYAEAEGYSLVREYVGHGIGRNMHEPPQVPNHGQAGHRQPDQARLRAGHRADGQRRRAPGAGAPRRLDRGDSRTASSPATSSTPWP